MLVEDDKSLREIYGIRLVAEGYEIVSAGDGEEALAMAVKERPDLILSDIMMPKISGFDMLDILRATPDTKDVKVIMMTALSSEEQRSRGEMLGANRYLVKSQVGIEDVVRTIKEVLDGIPASVTAAPISAPEPVVAAPAVQMAEPMPQAVPQPASMPTAQFSQPQPTTQPVVPVMEPQPAVAAPQPVATSPVSTDQTSQISYNQ